jgi:1-acyl-sn-glycerol-3-phosphate acyltransferase
VVWRGISSRIFYAICLFLSRMLGLLLFGVRIFGANRVPAEGGIVVAANHVSFLDPWIVGQSIPRANYYLARDSLFPIPILGRLIANLNALPIPREGAASRRAIELGRAVLRAGKSVLLFPEGTRSRDGRLGTIKRGVDLISRPTASPVVPAFIDGSFDAWPRSGVLTFRPTRVFFGRPIASEDRKENDGETGMCADLVARLTASYRSLEGWAREVRWTGARGARPGRDEGRGPRYYG